MTHKDKITSVIKGELIDVIPSYRECSMDITSLNGLIPKSLGNHVKDSLNLARFFDNSVCSVSIDIMQETLEHNENRHLFRYETGAVWEEKYTPNFCRNALSFPVNSPKEAIDYVMPSIDKEGRYDVERIKETVKNFHKEGYFVEGYVPGAWQTIYIFLTSFENILTWMVIEPDAAHALFEKTIKFSIEAAKLLLDCGVDCIFTASDLGTGSSLLFSKNIFHEYVNSWIQKLTDLCHKRNAYFHLHSHGHIEELMDDIVEAGVDIIDPIGPSDKNNLKMFKKRWGDNITIYGGISTTVAYMNKDEIKSHISEVMEIGKKRGRFIPRSESGLPKMSAEKLKFYLETLGNERRKGYII